MAFRFLSWLTSEAGQPESAPAAVLPPEPAAVGAEPALAGGPAEGLEVEPSAAALAGSLRVEVEAVIGGLRREAIPESDPADARRLLDALGGDVGAAIRRPPLAAQQAMSACRDPDASLGKILESFHQDPALTQALLKHANSAFYATGGSGCTSLHDAAQRIGLAGLHSVLMAATVEGLLCRPGGDCGPMVQQVWTHMVRTAPAARRLARAVGLPSETAYTLGLLHDLGKLIVFDRLTALRTSARHTARLGRSFLGEVLGRVHGPLGGLAALQWNIDPAGARAIATHPRGARRYRGERMSQVLAIAEWADLTTVRDEKRDYQAFWDRAGITLDLGECRAVLEEGR